MHKKGNKTIKRASSRLSKIKVEAQEMESPGKGEIHTKIKRLCFFFPGCVCALANAWDLFSWHLPSHGVTKSLKTHRSSKPVHQKNTTIAVGSGVIREGTFTISQDTLKTKPKNDQ